MRRNLRNMKKTMHRIYELRFQRTFEERNQDFLRKVNMLSLESLRFFSKEFN